MDWPYLPSSVMAISPSDLCVDGRETQLGVKVLSGSFHMTAALDHVIPSKWCHASICNHQPTLLETSFAQHISDLQPICTPLPLLMSAIVSKLISPRKLSLVIYRQCRQKTCNFMKMQLTILQLLLPEAGYHRQMDNNYCHVQLVYSLHV